MRNKVKCYCAFCKTQHSVYRKKSLSAVNVLQAIGLVAVTSIALWQGFNIKALPLFFIFLAGIEFFILIRNRAAAVCSVCGFDPYLYKIDQEKACARVKKTLETRREDPRAWLSPQPPQIPTKKKKNKSTSTREIVV